MEQGGQQLQAGLARVLVHQQLLQYSSSGVDAPQPVQSMSHATGLLAAHYGNRLADLRLEVCSMEVGCVCGAFVVRL